MIRLLSILIASMLLMAVSACESSSEERLPSRSECIVRINLQWPKVYNTLKRESIISNIGEAIGFSAAQGGPDMTIQAAFPRKRRDILYVQFSKDCQHRIEHAHALAAYLKKTVPDVPAMQVSKKVIKPSDDTINVWGSQWRDERPQ